MKLKLHHLFLFPSACLCLSCASQHEAEHRLPRYEQEQASLRSGGDAEAQQQQGQNDQQASTERSARARLDTSIDSTTSGLANENKVIVVTTPQRETLALARGYQTDLQLEGQNIDEISSVRVLQNGVPAKGISAKLTKVSETNATLAISVDKNASLAQPMQLQMLGADGRTPVPVEVIARGSK